MIIMVINMMLETRNIKVVLYSFCALMLLSGAAYGATVAEIEPNDNHDQAMPINVGDIVNGVVQSDGGQDWFKLTLPQSGIVTVSFTGPTDCKFQVSAGDFGIGWGVGSVNGENGKPIQFSFSAPKNKQGYISLNYYDTAGGVSGYDWSIIQCSKDGPYYALPNAPPRALSTQMPSSYEGKPVLPALTYQLQVTLQPLPDQYEPNNNKDEVTQTIPIGQEITAYLFNEYPQVMKGTPGYDNLASYGGENDVDIYRISLSQPDTVNVHLSNFPANANSRIIITQSDGSWEESVTGATEFSKKVTLAGNVFIEISKGTGNANLVYSTTPYKMLVTTGAAATTTTAATPAITPVIVTPSGNELITNGDFSSGLGGWTIQEWYKPSDGKGEVTAESDGIRFRGTSGNNHIGIMQTLNADVSGCTALNLRATIKADEQTLSGTGWNGRESPISVFARYTDINGAVHGNLGEDPNDPMRMYWYGLYLIDPTGQSITDYGIKTQKGEWYTYEADLMKLSPKPKTIDIIGAEGAGWPIRDGKVKSISLTCVAAAHITPTATATRTPIPYTTPKVTYTPVISATEPKTTYAGTGDFTVGISPTSITVNPGDTLRLTLTVNPSAGFSEPVDIYVKIKALGQEQDLGRVTTIYPPYKAFVFENPVPNEIPKGTTVYGYVTARGGGLERNADTVIVKVPGFGILPMIVAFGIAIILIRRKKDGI